MMKGSIKCHLLLYLLGMINSGSPLCLVTPLEVANLQTAMVTISSIKSLGQTLQRREWCNTVALEYRELQYVLVLCVTV